MPNLTEWLRSALAFTKAVGLAWFAVVVLAWDFADVWTTLRSVAGWLPRLPNPTGEIITAFLVVAVFIGAVHAYHKLRMRHVQLAGDLESDEPPGDVVRQFLREGREILSTSSNNVLAGPSFGEWEDRVATYLRARFGESSVSRFKAPVREPASNIEFPGQARRRRLKDRLDRLEELEAETTSGDVTRTM